MPAKTVGLDPSRRTGVFYGYIVVAVSSFSMALIFGVHYAFGVFFIPLTAEFGWTRAMTSGPFSLVWIMQGLLSIVMGGFNDRFGPRVVLSICAVLVGSGYLLTSQTHAIWQMYLFYGGLVGAGLGGTFVPLTSTAARWFVKNRGLMTGVVASGVGVGALVGPPIANWLIGAYSWRTSYLVLGAIVFVGVLAAAQFLKKDPAQVGAEPYGVSQGYRLESGDPTQGFSLLQAVATWQFWLVCAVFVSYGYTWTAILLHLVPHVTDLGFASAYGARMLAVLGCGSILGKVLLGMLADRIGNKLVYILSFAIMIAALLWLMGASSLWACYLFSAAFGFAYGGLAAAHSPLIAWLFGLRKHGLIYGVCFFAWTVGCAIGPLVAGHIFDVTHSYQRAFAVSCALCFLGLLMMLPLKPAFSKQAT